MENTFLTKRACQIFTLFSSNNILQGIKLHSDIKYISSKSAFVAGPYISSAIASFLGSCAQQSSREAQLCTRVESACIPSTCIRQSQYIFSFPPSVKYSLLLFQIQQFSICLSSRQFYNTCIIYSQTGCRSLSFLAWVRFQFRLRLQFSRKRMNACMFQFVFQSRHTYLAKSSKQLGHTR